MAEHRYKAEFASGFRAELVVSSAAMFVEWTPETPRLRGQRRRKFLRSYRAWRDDCIADYARRTGQTVMVVDL